MPKVLDGRAGNRLLPSMRRVHPGWVRLLMTHEGELTVSGQRVEILSSPDKLGGLKDWYWRGPDGDLCGPKDKRDDAICDAIKALEGP